jgi:hypothetical protein
VSLLLTPHRYLGHLVSGACVRPDPKKVAALDRWTPPVDLMQELALPTTSVKHACVLTKRIVKQVVASSVLCSTSADLFHVSVPWQHHCLISSKIRHLHGHQSAPWEQLKTCLSRATLMFHPDFSVPFHVYFDASLRGIGGLLVQERDGIMQPVAFLPVL